MQSGVQNRAADTGIELKGITICQNSTIRKLEGVLNTGDEQASETTAANDVWI